MLRRPAAPPVGALGVVAALSLVAALGCQAPRDTNRYDYVPPDASAAQALGAACDDDHPCGAGLACRVPSECRRAPDAGGTGTDGAAAGDRCDDARICGDGLACVALSEMAVCTADCTRDEECPAEAVCWTERGPAEGWCIRPDGLVGASCGAENDCAPGLFCENRAAGGYCTRECGRDARCPAGMDTICTRLSSDFGTYCLLRCDVAEDCREDVTCYKMTQADAHVCFPTF